MNQEDLNGDGPTYPGVTRDIEALWAWLRDHDRKEDDYHNKVDARLRAIDDTLAQAKGGWKVLVTLGTLVAVISSGFAWVWVNVLHGRPAP